MFVSAILLAGGKGSRMGTPLPKQFLPFQGHPLAHSSFCILSACKALFEVIVVCETSYRSYFSNCRFAHPGQHRQDSLASGLQAVSKQAELILIHDAARPFLCATLLDSLIKAGSLHGAAAPALPMKSTIKRAYQEQVIETLNRSELFEIQTPQILRADLLRAGLKVAETLGLHMTDDVSFAELLGHPVQLIPGVEENIKITTPFDLKVAEAILMAQEDEMVKFACEI